MAQAVGWKSLKNQKLEKILAEPVALNLIALRH
jgi:hypothetical protein